MLGKHAKKFIFGSKSFSTGDKAFSKLTKLTHLLKDVDLIDGRLFDTRDDLIIVNDRVKQKMHEFKSLARVFIGSRSVQDALATRQFLCFSKPSEREPVTVRTLKQVGSFLDMVKCERQLVRNTISRLVTQDRVWASMLKEILNIVRPELEYLNREFPTEGTHMGCQVLSNCLRLLEDTTFSLDDHSSSWMRVEHRRTPPSFSFSSRLSPPPPSHKWEDVLFRFNDLIVCMRAEDMLLDHMVKLESMKEGFFHVRDVLIDKTLPPYESRGQEFLVNRNLGHNLGFPSPCLFTLLLYYLCGQVRDFEIDLCGGIYRTRKKDHFMLFMGRILTSDDEKKVFNGMRQLDRVYVLYKYVWETSGRKEKLDFQGHLWCVGAQFKSFYYNGNTFFIHGITM